MSRTAIEFAAKLKTGVSTGKDLMRFTFSCIGKMKAGAEKDLLDRYIDRARKTGRGLGISDIVVSELSESRAQRSEDRKAEEAKGLLNSVSGSARVVVLDENGKNLTSPDFSRKIESWKDEGIPEVVFAIGGADGHGQELLARADLKLAFGAMTWPHQIARILLAEQVYRAMTILSGHPYHRI
ncbi:Ribosomal RNA large subunit methyltransferase H [Roseibium album]|uniref:Ribosomal RNA large subunit methyltransferase H n=2 Tax=Roseibium album TaxID=311410 RepID=A0A0M7B179_9HYPH|nr:Ribosomal RNA large subunit methyltransferase H [Roseibium album]CTQ68547.1 Ribosomal RNA large subunit methyltransferase H [Roseibium album]CTQ79604.1 Ribosomal RNA large subunit methyltransferase H [Roseibium album]